MEEAESHQEEQVVLEELYDENYEPTEAEILEYARWLGMDIENEQELLWIARAGLKEPVPDGWKPCQAPSKEIYYFNFITGESIWDHPCDEHFRKLYAQEKARLQEYRQQQAAQRPGQEGYQLQQQQEQQPQFGGAARFTALQDQPTGAQAPKLLLPSTSAAQRTDVEPLQIPLTSPSGTLSTIASGTTVSVAESPVGGLAQGTSLQLLDATLQQNGALSARPGLANGSVGPTGALHAQPAVPAVRRSLASGAMGGDATVAAAALGGVDWRAAAAAADQEERLKFRQQLEDERRVWEQHLTADLHAQHSALQQQHQQRLWNLTHDLQEQERLVAGQLRAEQDGRLAALREELQSTLKGLEQELQEAKAQHAGHMQQLHSQHEDLQARAASLLQQARQRLSASALTDNELSATQQKAAAAAAQEAVAEAAGHKAELLQVAKERAEQEVAAEVASYKASCKAAALKELAGHLDEDTTAAAVHLEQVTAELQQLEAAVADKAAVLQKLDEQVSSKQQQQQQQLLSLGSVKERPEEDTQGLFSHGREQLVSLQQQLSQAERQLAAADAALVEKRAAVAEAEEQLAAVRRETSVCEPRLSSLRQQLQELEAAIRACETEQQQRQADVALATKRLHELREEVTRRQGQLDSLEALYAERQESLRQTANELACRRGELGTLESSLSESLRRKADAEYQALEEQLRRTRKAAADAAAELSGRQAALAELTVQVSSKQVALEGLEASLAAKGKELQDVLAQLQAAAAQEFQDAKKLLLEEEARLLASERRSMQLRVADQVEFERRAALAAGRRRNERELSTQLAGEQAASLEQQQQRASLGIAAPLQSGGASPQQPSRRHTQQEQQSPSPGPGNVSSMREPAAAGPGAMEQPLVFTAGLSPAAAEDGSSRRRARSHSPVRQRHAAEAAARLRASAAPDLQQELAKLLQSQQAPRAARRVGAAGSSEPAGSGGTQHVAPAVEQAAGPEEGLSAGLQAAATAVAAQLKALGVPQGEVSDVLTTAAKAPQQQHRHRASQTPTSAQLSAYTSLLQQAKQVVKQRRRDIQQRQEAVLAAQADWRAVLSAMEEEQQLHAAAGKPVPPELGQAVQQLRQLKGVLQDQIRSLNEETQQVKALKARVQQLKSTVELLQLHGQPQPKQLDPAVNSLSSLLTSLSGLQHKQQVWQQQQQQQHRQPLLQQQARAAAQASPLDKVAAALQSALEAATSWSSSGGGALSAAGGGTRDAASTAAAAGSSSSRRSSLQPWPNGVTGSTLQLGSTQQQPGFATEGSWGTLNKMREERGAMQEVMQQHSRWLQGFREQVALVAALQPAVATRLQYAAAAAGQQVPAAARTSSSSLAAALSRSSVAVATAASKLREPAAVEAGPEGGGGVAAGDQNTGLSPVASSSQLLPSASSSHVFQGGQPLTLDIGGDQELVISVVHKQH